MKLDWQRKERREEMEKDVVEGNGAGVGVVFSGCE